MIRFEDKITLTFFGNELKYRENEIWIRTRVFADQLNLAPDEYFVFKLPKEFTDGASIPRIFWAIISPLDWRILIPSQAHDHLYLLLGKKKSSIKGYIWNKRTGKIVKKNVKVKFTRKDADTILEEKMVSFGGGIILRKTVKYSVRIFGYFVIKNKIKHNEKLKQSKTKKNK